MENDIKKIHPSYGVAQFSRISHSRSNTPLFGSSIGHGNTITLTINRAEEIRSTDLLKLKINDKINYHS